MSDTVLYIALAALLGLVVGSFLNVVVYRLPIMLVVLGGIVGVILVAMYLPLFNLGNVVG